MTTEDQPALFEVTTPPVRAPKRKPAGNGKPRWSPYAPKNPVKCDDCLTVLAETHTSGGQGPATRTARWRRVQDGTDLLLCYGHAEPRRAADDAVAEVEG